MQQNYFDVLRLNSDAKDKDIQLALEAYEKNLKTKQGSGSISPDELKAGLALLETMRAWAKDKEQVKAHREAFIKVQSDAIRAYFSTLPNHYEAYKKEVDSWSKRYRLSGAEIQKLMKEDPNHTIIQVKLQGLPPDFILTGFKNMQKSIDDLNNSPELAKIWSWTKQVTDFYTFLGFVLGKSPNEVRQMDTASLAKAVEQNRDPMTNQAGGGFGTTSKPLRDIFGNMLTVFDTKKPNMRTAYDNTLLYESLRPLFDSIKQSPEEVRKDDKFVENYLKQIKLKFNNDEIALAIYNKEANLLNDPYEPSKVVVSMQCANCGSITNFPTHDAAKHGKCEVCGSPFYIPCPSCGQMVPASSQTCSHCNFNIIEFRKVGQYYNAAKQALTKGDYSEARLYLQQAEAGDPKGLELKKFADFATIKQKIEKGYEEYSKYFAGLSSLIAAKAFYKAKDEAEKVKRQYPNLDLTSHMKRITEALDKVRAMMPGATDYTEAAALRCYEILEICSDYLPAKEHLRKVNLSGPENFRVVALQGATFGVSISWAPSKHSRVSYYLVRNDQHAPKTFSDGVVLIKEGSQTTFEDSKIEPGKAYYYAVFVTREGVFSQPVSARFAYFAEVEKLEALPVGVCTNISFVLPTNAIGVRILRKDNAIPVGGNDPQAQVIAANTRIAYDDKTVQLDHQYGYLVQAIYTENHQNVYSQGKGVLVRIERDPTDLEDVKIEKVNGSIQVKYRPVDVSSPNPVRLYTINPSLVDKRLHNLITAAELQAFIKGEKVLGSGKAKDGSFVLTIPGDYSYQVALISMTDSKARICGLGAISSIPTLEVDKKKTQIKDAGKAYVALKGVPGNCFGIHYLVLEANHAKNEITDEDIQRHTSGFMQAAAYNREGIIDVRGRAISSGTFKLLLRGEFVLNGNHVFSQTSATVISSAGPRTINYALKWEKKGLFKKTYLATLNILCKGGLPDLVLMAKGTGAPVSASDINAMTVLEISADSPDLKPIPGGFALTVPGDFCQPGMNFRLFLKEPDDETKVAPSDYSSLACPK